MLLTPWLSNVHKRMRVSRRRRPRASQAVLTSAAERLETRTLLAATVFSSAPGAGTLFVDTDVAGESITITRDGGTGEVRVNGAAVTDTFTGLATLADDVLAIDVDDPIGGDNTMDLSGVTKVDFPAVTDGAVLIVSRGGFDTVIGSEYSDSIRTVAGNDSS